MIELYAQIEGAVQMVSLRDFVCHKARARGLTGYVRNKLDGSVEVLAQGEEEKIQTFVRILEKGSPLARVEKVKVELRKPTEHFGMFEVRL